MSWPCRHITQTIHRAAGEVVAFAGNPENLPRWAAGLSAGIRRHGDAWVTDSPMGVVTVRFAPANALGVLDHDVTLPDGTTVHNPLRVLPNAGGAEVVFTLFHRDGVSDEAFERDATMVAADLATLRRILENEVPSGGGRLGEPST